MVVNSVVLFCFFCVCVSLCSGCYLLFVWCSYFAWLDAVCAYWCCLFVTWLLILLFRLWFARFWLGVGLLVGYVLVARFVLILVICCCLGF